MALNLKDMPTTGGGFLKPEDHRDDVAILVEVTGYQAQRPGNFGPKDSIIADVTFFASDDALDAGEPTKVAKGMRIEYTVLTRDLNDNVGVGGATIVKLAQSKPKPGQKPAWVWRVPADDVKAKVVAFAEAREAALAAAIEAAPDFD